MDELGWTSATRRRSRHQQEPPEQDWRAYPPRQAQVNLTGVRWSKGRPVIRDWRPDRRGWESYPIERAFDVDVLRKIYLHNTVFRGGVIPIYNGQILLVKEMNRIVIDDTVESSATHTHDSRSDIMPGLYGFAKGALDTGDKSLIDTALREYKEELGVSASPADIWYPALIIERETVNEVLAFFPIIYDEPPLIKLDPGELDGYQWVSLPDANQYKKEMSNPTQAIIGQLAYFAQMYV